MNSSWYFRFLVIVLSVVLAWFVLWPTVDAWIPAPDFVKKNFTSKINQGLDIQGGIRLMYEVEVDEYIRDRRDRMASQLQRRLASELGILEEDKIDSASREQMDVIKQRIQIERIGKDQIKVRLTQPADKESLSRDWLRDNFAELKIAQRADQTITIQVREELIEQMRKTAVDQVVKTINDRIDGLQIREMTVIGRGDDIIVEVPTGSNTGEGALNDDMLKRVQSIISRTAQLQFKVVAHDQASELIQKLDAPPEGITTEYEQASVGEGKSPVVAPYFLAKGENSRTLLKAFVDTLQLEDGFEVRMGRADRTEAGEEAWRTYFLYSSTNVTGEDIEEAFVAVNPQNKKPEVSIQFKRDGAKKFGLLTERNTKRAMAIVLDGRVESAPVIQEKIAGGSARITLGGGFKSYEEILNDAEDLVVVLKAGALPAPLRPANDQRIGPSLGKDSVIRGAKGALLGVILILIFMAVYYHIGGLVADLMVLLNLLFLLAILAGLEATLTLPGIAGIALTVGMAVDANVLITERIREELRLGKSPAGAVEQGYKRAFWSVFDSQITTFIAGLLLFQFGTGPIKGFAVTLMVGIVTSLFSAIFCSRVMFEWIVRGLKVSKLKIG